MRGPSVPPRRSAGHGPAARSTSAALLVTALLGFLALNFEALDGWWVRDDPCVLARIVEDGLGAAFASEGAYLQPWWTLSLGLDWLAFGLRPGLFHAHQIIAFGVLIALAFAAHRFYLRPVFAFMALVPFVVSSPAVHTAQLLMARHYVEGFVFFLAAALLFRSAVRQDRAVLAVGAAALYGLAALAKEVFVPLVLLLPFLGVGRGRRSLRHSIPLGVVAVGYGAWRLAELGWSGSFAVVEAGRGSEEGAIVAAAGHLGLHSPGAIVVALAIVAVALVVAGWRNPALQLAALCAAVVLVLPLLPVGARIAPRHLLVPLFFAGGLIAAAVQRLQDAAAPGRRWLPPVAVLVIAASSLSALASSGARNGLAEDRRHYRAEGSFILNGESEGILLTSLWDVSYLECVERLRRLALRQEGGPGYAGDPCYAKRQFPAARLWHYREGRITSTVSEVPEDCAVERAFSVRMAHDAGRSRVSWRFGPDPAASYAALLVMSDKPGVSIPLPLPAEGEMPFVMRRAMRVVVRCDSPQGWRAYSPPLRLESGGRLAWDGEPEAGS